VSLRDLCSTRGLTACGVQGGEIGFRAVAASPWLARSSLIILLPHSSVDHDYEDYDYSNVAKGSSKKKTAKAGSGQRQ
jgi:hypothetical protein